MRKTSKSNINAHERALLKVIHDAIPENYTGHSRANAVGLALQSFYAHQSELAKCRAIARLTKTLADNNKMLNEALVQVVDILKK